MGNIMGSVGATGTVAAIASSTVTFSQQTNGWIIVAFALGPILAFFVAEEIIRILDERRGIRPVIENRP